LYSAYINNKTEQNRTIFSKIENAKKVYKKNLAPDFLKQTIYYEYNSGAYFKFDCYWIPESQELYFYDAQNRIIEYLKQSSWPDRLLCRAYWVNKTRTLYSYSTGLQPIEIVDQQYKNNSWVNVSRSMMTYNAQNNIIEVIDQEWDGSAWVNKTKIIINYSSDKLQDIITMAWSSNSWENESKISYTYNSSGYVITITTSEWSNGIWKDVIRHLKTYDSKGNNILEEHQTYENGTLISNNIINNTYDTNNRLVEEITQMITDIPWFTPKDTGFFGKEFKKVNYTYDNNGNNIQTIQYDCMPGSWGSWVLRLRETTTFDKFNKEIEKNFDYFNYSGVWLYTFKKVFIYGSSVNSVNDDITLPDKFILSQNYPNPFNPSTKIKVYIPEKTNVNLSIYNLLGEKVVTLVNNELSIGKYEFTFEAKNLPSGVYFYRLETPKQTITKKMILSK
jgi:hypothetical protein